MHERFLHTHEDILPLQVIFLTPWVAPMVSRGEKTEAFYVGMVALVSTLRSVYQHSLRDSLRGSLGATQRLASIGAESMASTRHIFRQSRADIAALLRGGASKGKSKNMLPAMG